VIAGKGDVVRRVEPGRQQRDAVLPGQKLEHYASSHGEAIAVGRGDDGAQVQQPRFRRAGALVGHAITSCGE
jgi:hypothetical protein